MSELILPPDILPESPERIELVDDQTFVFTPQFARGYTQRNSFGDPRWRIKRRYRGMRDHERARLQLVVGEARGALRTVWLSPAQSVRGSFPTGELLTNADFSSGTTGWSATDGTLSADNRVLRITRYKGSAETTIVYQSSGNVTAYYPHVLRSLAYAPLWPQQNLMGNYQNDVDFSSYDYPASRGLYSCVLIPRDNSGTVYAILAAHSGAGYEYVPPGVTIDLLFTSRSRCFLVDNGQNRLTYSNDLANAAWIKTACNVSVGDISPDNSNTAVSLLPTTASSFHYVYQSVSVSSATSEYVLAGAFKSNGYNYVRLQMTTTTDSVAQVFNLSTGALGTAAYTGSGWKDRRSFIAALGDGWYYCAVVCRKTSSETSLDAIIMVGNGDSLSSFTGDGTSAIIAWRPTFAPAGVPVRLIATGSSSTDGTGQTGGAIYVCGLPTSTTGLLLPGDWVDIDGQLKQVTLPLNSDAAGLGLLTFRPGLHKAPAHLAPVVVTKPMGRFLLRDSVGWDALYGHYVDLELTFDEVYT